MLTRTASGSSIRLTGSKVIAIGFQIIKKSSKASLNDGFDGEAEEKCRDSHRLEGCVDPSAAPGDISKVNGAMQRDTAGVSDQRNALRSHNIANKLTDFLMPGEIHFELQAAADLPRAAFDPLDLAIHTPVSPSSQIGVDGEHVFARAPGLHGVRVLTRHDLANCAAKAEPSQAA